MITKIIGLTAWILPGLAAFATIGFFVDRKSKANLPNGLSERAVAIGFACVFLISSLVAWSLAGIENDAVSPQSTPSPTPTPTPMETIQSVAKPTPVLTTTVDEILETYAENQIAGARKFDNRRVEVTGVAKRVREALGTGILVLRSPNTGSELELYFTEAAEVQLADVKAGRPTRAVCLRTFEIAGNVAMSDCREVSQ